MPPQIGVGKRQAMRNGQNKRMRGRNRKGQNPLTRVYESNGPDVKIRGTASHIADKYIQLARDAQASGDPVGAENYFQHAEHYFRLIAAAQEQFRQANPYYRPEQDARDDFGDEPDDEATEQPAGATADQPFGTGEPQPYLPREAQPFQPREPQAYGGREHRGRPQPTAPVGEQQSPDALPAFITGGAQQQPQGEPYQGYRQPNGFDGGQGDRFPLHRRRRRHRGPRGDQPGASQSMGSEPSDEPPTPGRPAGE
jgi:Domain of unknown function (DUF4167)